MVHVQHNSGKVSLHDGFEMIRRICTVQGNSAIGIGVSTTIGIVDSCILSVHRIFLSQEEEGINGENAFVLTGSHIGCLFKISF